MVNGIVKVLSSKNKYPFIMSKSVNDLKILMSDKLPSTDEIFKFISVSGGFASVSFIKYVADREIIEELTASTLRIGEKQFNYLKALATNRRLKSARFFIGSKGIMQANRSGKYDYFSHFIDCCSKNNWKYYCVNNHSKIILMRTAQNYYVLETSSNLNENPQIEQYSFENSKQLYDFYYGFFNLLDKR